MHRGLTAKTVVAALIVACAWSAPWAAGSVKLQRRETTSSVAVVSTVVVGDAVAVTVANTAKVSAVVTVQVVAMVDGVTVTAVQSATVNANSSTELDYTFDGTVDGVISVGLIDDSSPTY